MPFLRYILAFTVENLLNKEMKEFVDYWNTHANRRCKQDGCPSGIPEDLYEMPSTYGIYVHKGNTTIIIINDDVSAFLQEPLII